MNNYFECTIKYEKTLENGVRKKISEKYLVDSISFTEAENRIIEEIKPFITSEFTVSDIKRAKYSEIYFCNEEEADKWFKVKINFITIDEKSGKEKKSKFYVLTQAESVDDARIKTDSKMKDTMNDYEIKSISETEIMDVFEYK